MYFSLCGGSESGKVINSLKWSKNSKKESDRRTFWSTSPTRYDVSSGSKNIELWQIVKPNVVLIDFCDKQSIFSANSGSNFLVVLSLKTFYVETISQYEVLTARGILLLIFTAWNMKGKLFFLCDISVNSSLNPFSYYEFALRLRIVCVMAFGHFFALLDITRKTDVLWQ